MQALDEEAKVEVIWARIAPDELQFHQSGNRCGAVRRLCFLVGQPDVSPEE